MAETSDTSPGQILTGADELVQSIVECDLMSSEALTAFIDSLPGDSPPESAMDLAGALVRAGKISEYQAKAVLCGRSERLFLGEYEIVDRIGEGGMGQVYKARHRRMDRVVALKVLPPRLVSSEKSVKRFEQEVRAAAKLAHPNIVPAFDAGKKGNVHYLVMEYVDGKDLAVIVAKQGPLPVANVINFMLQAAKGLAYAHEKGVIHRDIKPGNLLLDREGTVKILDMGLARFQTSPGSVETEATEGLTAAGQIMGTCDYMSPEQAVDTRNADARSDIYSLGCTLFCLIAARPPYEGDTIMKKLLAHRTDPIPSLGAGRDDVPERLDGIYRRMLAKDPADRYQKAMELVAEFESCEAQGGGGTPAIQPQLHAAMEPTIDYQPKEATDSATQGNLFDDETWTDVAAGPTLAPVSQSSQGMSTHAKRTIWIAGAAAGLLLLLLALWAILPGSGPERGIITINSPGDNVEVLVQRGGKEVARISESTDWTARIDEGDYTLELCSGEDKYELEKSSISLAGDGHAVVKVVALTGAGAGSQPPPPVPSVVTHPEEPIEQPSESTPEPRAPPFERPDPPRGLKPLTLPALPSVTVSPPPLPELPPIGRKPPVAHPSGQWQRVALIAAIRPGMDDDYMATQRNITPGALTALHNSNFHNLISFVGKARDGGACAIRYFDYTGGDLSADYRRSNDDPALSRWRQESDKCLAPLDPKGGGVWRPMEEVFYRGMQELHTDRPRGVEPLCHGAVMQRAASTSDPVPQLERTLWKKVRALTQNNDKLICSVHRIPMSDGRKYLFRYLENRDEGAPQVGPGPGSGQEAGAWRSRSGPQLASDHGWTRLERVFPPQSQRDPGPSSQPPDSKRPPPGRFDPRRPPPFPPPGGGRPPFPPRR